ncbi:DNA segregation ATPase FtsK/SpoIIIE, S-DNA-T family [Jatrophihabitans endophyticus]|uniref:DNA segregation ATPase FtsK/SpoIIIE, S-DNA-T family n=1 Tax=Jatrophihabitans endophyticus TaxID=1206085 RepID=A0A1M5N3K8_9ACTN|nr:FtsK/SpoIIIE domain-containing protein [Jatrophihabitans endophyticus]SHG84154.1 DNA segregation ATPase FtsK/SpoIIIE, S-DNA-T family [Jatrophihabitans endophyticus]
MELELTVVAADERRDVTVRLGDATTVAQLRAALAPAAPPGGSGGLWLGHHLVPDAEPVSTAVAAGLRSGAVVGLDGPVGAPPAAEGPVVVAAVGGLAAGTSSALGPDRVLEAGRSPACGLRLRDPEVSRRHAAFRLGHGVPRLELRDLGSRNGVGHHGSRLPEFADVDLGEPLRLGETVVEARPVRAVAADLTDDPVSATRAFNRPPHLETPRRPVTLVEPAEPKKPGGFRMPWIAALAPLVLGGVIFAIFPQYGAYLVIMMLLSPIMLVANAVSERRGGKKSYAAQLRDFRTDTARYREELAAAVRGDERESRAAAPDPAELIRRGVTPDAALWQRRRRGERFLSLRVGLTDRAAAVTLQRAGSDAPEPVVPVVHDVPVEIGLREAGVLGVAGPRDALLAAARALVTQTAVLHSPGDVGLVVVTGSDTRTDWEWTGWLPHTRPTSDAFACRRLVAVDGDQAAARMAELLRLVDERTAEQRARLSGGPPPRRAVVVVLDGARRMRAVPGIARLLAHGPAVGVYAICLDADETALPDECGATVVAATPTGSRATVRVSGRAPVEDVLVDGCGHADAERVARSLTPIHALGDGDAERELPDRVRFTELAGLDVVGTSDAGGTGGAVAADAVARRWATAPGGRSSRALLGMAAGEPVVVDLVKDGPHGLVAGTSGSGKSELLQTFVASLALANRPDALNFVLVDYKGGSAFAACSELPHCAGLITDLDGHLVTRALDSLSAELKRRETLLAEAGAKDIADYWARTGARLPRLVIVVDEFASLVEEVPDFVPGVVGIGMRGRSLGVHVVLATQRPGGVVSADMRANLNLRISLRVTSDAESTDVIETPAAARILAKQPGRGYVRTGHGELTAFQAARVGWPLPADDAPPDDAVDTTPTVTPRPFDLLGQAPEQIVTTDVDTHGRTDLTEIVRAIRRASAAADVELPRRPWLPPLPAEVPVDLLPAVPRVTTSAVLGLVDRPAAQAQDPFALDLDRTGPVVVGGAVRSGRSTALRTLAGSLADAASPADVHLYVLDCGNHALAAVAGFPHTGAVVDGADEARTERLFAMLAEEVARRQRIFAGGGHGSLTEQRAAVAVEDRLPHVVLLLDRLESFVNRYEELNNGVLLDRLETLLRTGPAVGVTCVLASDRTGLTHRLGSAVAARLVLAQATPEDLVYFGVDARAVPSSMPPGRAIWTPTGEEVQVAVLGADPSGTAQLARLRELGAELTRRWDGLPAATRPQRLDPLPVEIGTTELESLRSVARPGGPAVVTVGVGGDHLGPVDVDVAELGGSFVVCGPARSGRSTALLAMVRSLDGTVPVLVAAPRPSPLRELAGPHVTVLVTDVAARLAAALDGGDGADGADGADGGPRVVVVDDAELLDDHALQPVLERFVRGSRDTGSVLLAAGTTDDILLNRYRGWLATARRERCGLILNPASHVDGEVFEVKLPRSTAGGWPTGRALLVRSGATSIVQVAVPDAAAREARS